MDKFRTSIDTLYVGISDALEGDVLALEKIKNYLFSKAKISMFEKEYGNCFYNRCCVSLINGIQIYYFKRGNLKNDDITIQLSGKFFRDFWFGKIFTNWLFTEFKEFIHIQRIDIALDIMYREFPNRLLSNSGLNGFPIPHYNTEYKYKQTEFEYYSRKTDKTEIYTNMIATGKGDIRLRVYDKNLDILEKYGKSEKIDNYSDYYYLEDYYESVYRIELQCRGKCLKGFLDDYLKYEYLDYDKLITYILRYMFHKFSFEFIVRDDFFDFNDKVRIINFNHIKKDVDLEKSLKWHKARQNSEYFKVLDIAEQMEFRRNMNNALNLVCKKESDKKKIDLYQCYREFFSLNKEDNINI